MLLPAAEYVAECHEFGAAVADQWQGIVVMGYLGRRGKAVVATIGIQPHTACADQGQVAEPGTDQVGQLPLRLKKLHGEGCERGEARPAAIRVQGEKATVSRLRDDPVQSAIAVQVAQRLSGGTAAVGVRDAR
ncbi:hypothetical protein D3C85_1062330 [compost metagenome]